MELDYGLPVSVNVESLLVCYSACFYAGPSALSRFLGKMRVVSRQIYATDPDVAFRLNGYVTYWREQPPSPWVAEAILSDLLAQLQGTERENRAASGA